MCDTILTKTKGNAPAGKADITAAKAVNPKIADEFSRYGLK
jgi:hypothetical protein